MYKKIYLFGAIAAIMALSCTKDESQVSTVPPVPAVSLTNANGSAKTVDFFIDGDKKTQVATVGVNGTIVGTYVGLKEGTTHNIVVKDAAAGNAELFNGTITPTANQSYNFFVYDTLITGKLKGILLVADREIPSSNLTTAKVRFLNLSPKSPAMDLWMIRRVGGVAKDSVNIGSRPYLGSVATPDVTALSAYTVIPASEVANSAGPGIAASDYIIRLKLAGTNTIVSSSAATTIIPSRNYTIFARGTYPSSAVTLLLNN